MLPSSNLEVSPKPDERSPLLEGTQSPEQEQEEVILADPPRHDLLKVWVIRIFWAIVALCVLGVFVKGWIDADDVNVRIWLQLCSLVQI